MKNLLIFFALLSPGLVLSQQVVDSTFSPSIKSPEYNTGKGPVVFIDEGHYNLHTKNFRYKSFADLLEKDGYIVAEYKGELKNDELKKGKIIVISNALNVINDENWFLPTPSAFSKEEIETVRQWVNDGGSLFLIADHMPMAGAATDMAAAFGFEFSNGFALDSTTDWRSSRSPSVFSLENKTLIESNITNGRNENEKVKIAVSFTGQGFNIPDDATPILVFNENFINLLPDTAWVFDDNTSNYNIKGWSQGAYRKYGKGRVVVFGEAGMFTAQLVGPDKRKMGMNSEFAPENFQLLLNIIHWLDGKFI